MLALFLVICFVFVLFLGLLSFQTMKKHCFPCNCGVLCVMEKAVYVYVLCFVLAFLFLMLFVCNLNNNIALFCVCVVWFFLCL